MTYATQTQATQPSNEQHDAIRWILDNRRPEIGMDKALATLRFALATAPASLAVLEEIAREATPVSQGRPLRVRFTRKPCDLNEVLRNTDPDPTASKVVIEKHVELSSPDYDEFAENLLVDRPWLKGLGGWLNKDVRNAVMVTAPERTTLYVDPSGSAYGRYVGVAV